MGACYNHMNKAILKSTQNIFLYCRTYFRENICEPTTGNLETRNIFIKDKRCSLKNIHRTLTWIFKQQQKKYNNNLYKKKMIKISIVPHEKNNTYEMKNVLQFFFFIILFQKLQYVYSLKKAMYVLDNSFV